MKIKLTRVSDNAAIGEVRLEEGKTVVAVKDEKTKRELEEFFAKPIEYKEALEVPKSGISATVNKTVQPDTKDFLVRAAGELSKFGLKGTLEGEYFEV